MTTTDEDREAILDWCAQAAYTLDHIHTATVAIAALRAEVEAHEHGPYCPTCRRIHAAIFSTRHP